MREEKRVQHQNVDTTSSKTKREESTCTTRSKKGFTLQRRLSTATDIKYDMYLMNLGTMLKLFGSVSDRKKNLKLCHQDLLEKEGVLTRFEDLPLGSFVMFLSHQWNGFEHPDPQGRQLQVLCKLMRELRDGVHANVSTDPYHVLLYVVSVYTVSMALPRNCVLRILFSMIAFFFNSVVCQPITFLIVAFQNGSL